MKLMRYSALMLLASCAAVPAAANDNVRTAIILESDCELVVRAESVAGESIGNVTGAVAGGMLTSLVFGREYAGIGALVGGVGGSAVGAKVGESRTYKCLVKAQTSDRKHIYVETTGRLRNVGQSLVLVKDQSGNWLVRP